MPSNYIADPKITPRGIAIFPNIRKPDVYNGKIVGYTIRLKLTPEEIQKIENEMKELIEKVRKMPEFQNKDFSHPSLPINEEKDGSKSLKFKSKHEYSKNGQVTPIKIKVFDAKCQEIDNDEEIPHGSTVKIAYVPNVFYASSRVYGVTLRISAIQLIKKAPVHKKDMTAKDFGFQVEPDGFSNEGQIENVPLPDKPLQENLPPQESFSYNENQNPLY